MFICRDRGRVQERQERKAALCASRLMCFIPSTLFYCLQRFSSGTVSKCHSRFRRPLRRRKRFDSACWIFWSFVTKGFFLLSFVFRRFPLRHPSWRQHDTPSPYLPFLPITNSGEAHSAFHRLLSRSGSRLFDSRRRFSLFCILIHSSPYSRRSARFEFRRWRASPTPTSCVSSVFSLLSLPKTSWKSTQRSSRSSASSSCPSRWTL